MWFTDWCDLEASKNNLIVNIITTNPFMLFYEKVSLLFLHAFQQVIDIYIHGLDNIWTKSSNLI